MSSNAVQSKYKKLPRLRFPGFTGEWKEVRLGNFLKHEPRQVPKPSGPYKAIGIRSHFKGTFQKPDSDPSKIAMEELFLVKENDFIVNITFAWEGALAIAKREDAGGLVSHRFPTYIFDENISSPNYFRYVFPTPRMKYVLGIISPGGAGRNRVLNKKDFLNIKAHLPSVAEQNKISRFLESIDKWIDNLRSQKEALESYQNGMIKRIFSREIRFKNDKGGMFPEWKETSLGNAGEVNPGQGELPNEFIYIDLESVEKGILKQENKIKKTEAPSRAQRILKKNDILFPMVRPYQQNNLLFNLDGNYVASTGYAQIRTDQNPMFLFQYLHTSKFLNDVRLRCTGSSYPAINSNDLKKIKINLPSLPEQQKIADFLASINDLVKSKEQQIFNMEEWKKGLMQELFV